MKFSVSVQEVDFDFSVEVCMFMVGEFFVGVVVSFVGLVCDNNDGIGVVDMILEYYLGMIEKVLSEIVVKVGVCWQLFGVCVIYCVGYFKLGEQIVFVVVSSLYCGEVFVVCEFIMDYFKIQVLFWKKESMDIGSCWVDVRDSDESVLDKWKDEIGLQFDLNLLVLQVLILVLFLFFVF